MPKVSQQHKMERKEQLISAAEQVFLKKGYSRTTIQDVMEEANVSRGGLYLYFGNKAEIFEAVLERYDQRVIEDLNQLLTSDNPVAPALLRLATPSGDIEDNDRRRIAMVVEYNFDNRDDPDRRRRILPRYDRVVSLLSQVIQAGADRGEFHPTRPIPSIARFLISAQDGWAVHVAVLGQEHYEPSDYGGILEVVLQRLLGF